MENMTKMEAKLVWCAKVWRTTSIPDPCKTANCNFSSANRYF